MKTMALVMIALAFAVAPASSQEPLVDPGFELSNNDGQFPNSGAWTSRTSGGEAGAVLSQNAARTATYGLWQYTGAAGTDFWSEARQTIPARTGTVYTGTAWIRTPAGEAWVSGSKARVRIYYKNSAGGLMGYVESSALTTAGADWAQYSVATPPVASNVAYVMIALRTEKPRGRTGQAISNFDDASLAISIQAKAPVWIMGFDYSPFQHGQNPDLGKFPSVAQMRLDMPILGKMTDTIRTYSCLDRMGKIPLLAAQRGLAVVAGAWLGGDDNANIMELTALANAAIANSNVIMVCAGSETLFRFEKGYPNGLSSQTLVSTIQGLQSRLGAYQIPVATAEPWHIWLNHPELANAVDAILVNGYGYWESLPAAQNADYVVGKVQQIKAAYPNKRVVISETGWPTAGEAQGAAVPGLAEQTEFTSRLLSLVQSAGIELLFFEAFDEEWKTAEPNGVGPHWGLYDSRRRPKGPITRFLATYLKSGALTDSPAANRDSASALLINCQGLENVAADFTSQTFHVKIGPYEDSRSSSLFRNINKGARFLFQEKTAMGVITYDVRPKAKTIRIAATRIQLPGAISNPVPVEVSIGDRQWKSNLFWRTTIRPTGLMRSTRP